MLRIWDTLTKTVGTLVVIGCGLFIILFVVDELTKKPILRSTEDDYLEDDYFDDFDDFED